MIEILTDHKKSELEKLRRSLMLADAGYAYVPPAFPSCGVLLSLIDRLVDTTQKLQDKVENLLLSDERY